MKAVGDRMAPARGTERPDEAARAQPPRQEQKRFERALQRAARREEDAPEAAPDASAGPMWGRPSVAVGARDVNAAPMDAGATAMLRPLPAAARDLDDAADLADFATEAAAPQPLSLTTAPALRAAAFIPAAAPSAPLPPSPTALALQRSALAAGTPSGAWQLLLPGQALPLRAVELQRQPGAEPSLRLHLSAHAAQPVGAAALDRLRARLARHGVETAPGDAGRSRAQDDDLFG